LFWLLGLGCGGGAAGAAATSGSAPGIDPVTTAEPAAEASPREASQTPPGSAPAEPGAGAATPTRTEPPGPYLHLASGNNHACAVTSGGRVECWGHNYSGQLGVGPTGEPMPLGRVVAEGVTGAVHVSAGRSQTCALLADGLLSCFPAGAAGAPEGAGFAQVAMGTGHLCTRRESGEVGCWGVNRFAQLGRPASQRQEPWQAVAGIDDAVHVSAADAHTCAVRRAGEVWCWGRNDGGQLGDGRRVRPPRLGEPPAGIEAVAEMQPYDGHCGRMGLDCLDERLVTVPIRSAPGPVVGLANARLVAAGLGHTCAVRADGDVWCWGRNDQGQLGRRPSRDGARARAVRGVADAIEVAVGILHSCALRRDGRVLCWGRNVRGAIGDGTTENRVTPTLVPGVEDAVQISAGGDHSCARLRDGRLLCWGSVDGGNQNRRLRPTGVDG